MTSTTRTRLHQSRRQRTDPQVDAFNEEMDRAGAWVFGGGLDPASSATVVRAERGEVSMTDGPYAETKEQMGGFWVIEAADLDAALEWAGKAAAACEGPVEVRPIAKDELTTLDARSSGARPAAAPPP